MREAVIVAVAMTRFGRWPDKTVVDLGAEAVSKVLEAANMSYKDIQFAVCGNVMDPNPATGLRTLMTLGNTGIPVFDVDTACASGGSALMIASQAIATGKYDKVLCFGTEKTLRRGMLADMGERWQQEMGIATGPNYFAMQAQRYMYDYGVTPEQLAKVAVKAKKNGSMNPYAWYQKPVTLEEVLNSPMVADPLRQYMFCTPDEGAAAVILCDEETAKKYTDKPIKMAATVVQTCEYPQPLHLTNYSSSTTIEPTPVTILAAKKAYEQAGIGPEGLDVVELQDTEVGSELVHMEQLGLCKPGEAARLVEEGATEIGGRIPVNPSGGILSKGEPVGASGLGQVCEIVWQLRGEAGPRQVNNPKVGLCHVWGAGNITAVVILKR